MTTHPAQEIQLLNETAERLRADMRAAVAGEADEYRRALERAWTVERAYAQDPDLDDRQDQAKDARVALEKARDRFDRAVAAAKGVRTRALNEAMGKK